MSFFFNYYYFLYFAPFFVKKNKTVPKSFLDGLHLGGGSRKWKHKDTELQRWLILEENVVSVFLLQLYKDIIIQRQHVWQQTDIFVIQQQLQWFWQRNNPDQFTELISSHTVILRLLFFISRICVSGFVGAWLHFLVSLEVLKAGSRK